MKCDSAKAMWLVLVGALALVFIASALLRPSGLLAEKQLSHTWLTCNTVTFARNWYHEGAVALRFRMVSFPRSVETPELKDRRVYASYPPGAVVPVWLAAKVVGAEPSIKMVVAVNIGIQFLVALGLAGIVLNLLSGLGNGFRLAGGATAGLFYLCAGAPFQFHWIAYFSDTLILLPIVLLLWLESFRALDESRHVWVRFVIPAVVFCGALTDPLMAILAAVLSVWRLIAAEKGSRGKAFRRIVLELALPVVLALGLYLLQVLTGGLLDSLVETFRRRSLLDAVPEKTTKAAPLWRFLAFFRISDLRLLLIPCGIAVVFSSAERVPFWRTVKRRTALVYVLLVACAVQLLVFWNHSFVHSFSVLKLYVPASLLAGLTVASGVGDGRWWKVRLAAVGISFLVLTPVIWHKERAKEDAMPPYPFMELVQHIARTATYRDVYLSPVLAISNAPPQLLSFTRKNVWGVKNGRQVEAILAPVRDQPCTLHFLVLNTPEIAALFSSVPGSNAVHRGLTEYVVDGRDYSALATNLDCLFKGQDGFYRKPPDGAPKKDRRAYLVPWKKR